MSELETQEERIQEEETLTESIEEEKPVLKKEPPIVTIKTPLDRPEFDTFLELYCEKMGIPNKKQAAILLTKTFSDMGFNPYSELEQLMPTIDAINRTLSVLPDTPSSKATKDTINAVVAAKVGDQLLKQIPQLNKEGQDQFMKIMDRFLPQVMAMRILMGGGMGDMGGGNPGKNPEMEYMMKRLERLEGKNELQDAVNPLIVTMNQMGNQIDMILNKEEGVYQASPESELQVEKSKVKDLERKAEFKDEIQPLREELGRVTAKLETIGKEGGTETSKLTDLLDALITITNKMDEVGKKFKSGGEGGMLDWRAVAISTFGEVSKEAVKAFKETRPTREERTRERRTREGRRREETPSKQVTDGVVDKRVLNYVLKQIEDGAAEIDTGVAARKLNLAPGEVEESYYRLQKSGALIIKKPSGERLTQRKTPRAKEEFTEEFMKEWVDSD